MSILIKGMWMPENCWDCPLQYDYICCSVMDDIKLTDENMKKRDSNCPLEEVSCMNSEKTHDVISRQAAIDIVQGYAEQLQGYIGMPNDSEVYAYARGLLLSIDRNIKALPSAQPGVDLFPDVSEEYKRGYRDGLHDKPEPQIVRCKDCKYSDTDNTLGVMFCWRISYHEADEDGFCSWAERRTDDGE